MKKLFAICALIVGCAVSVMAQDYPKFFPLTGVNQVSDSRFEAVSGAQKLGINSAIYTEVAANPGDYLMVVFKGTKASAITLARKDKIIYVVTELVGVDSLANGKLRLRFSSGEKKSYGTSNMEWLAAQPGQHVSYMMIDGETKIIAYKPHTVGREVALTTTVPISPVPTEVVLPLDAENRIIEE